MFFIQTFNGLNDSCDVWWCQRAADVPSTDAHWAITSPDGAGWWKHGPMQSTGYWHTYSWITFLVLIGELMSQRRHKTRKLTWTHGGPQMKGRNWNELLTWKVRGSRMGDSTAIKSFLCQSQGSMRGTWTDKLKWWIDVMETEGLGKGCSGRAGGCDRRHLERFHSHEVAPKKW